MNKTLRCPNCGKEFEVDETQYNELIAQVRGEQFEKELQARVDAELALAKAKAETIAKEERAKKDKEVNDLSNQINILKEQIKGFQAAKEAEINNAIAKTSSEVEILKAKLDGEKDRIQNAIKDAEAKKDAEIAKLSADLAAAKVNADLKVVEATGKQEKELESLKAKLEASEKNNILEVDKLKELHDNEVKALKEQVGYYKDLKAKMTTKMVGETLEEHCNVEFNKMRAVAFPNADFDKDNKVSETGSKGDFIFRDYEDETKTTEIVSIMFEMKNECDTTSTKKKNVDFLAELDKDRREKGCEYAVLVSLLEPDSELYNQGIVDMSYKYEKMYIIRPQFFLPLISMLRNANTNAIAYKKELAIVKEQNIDVTNFEKNLADFKDAFGRNYRLASDKFKNAIEEINKTITHLEKVRDALVGSDNQLRLANDKAEDLSIKKLTKDAPKVAEMIAKEKDK